ncbi:zinc ribbon domain-containing protein [Streptomyces sp. INA 01156]
MAFRTGKVRRNALQAAVYHRLKADFDLGAQPAVRVVKKVCDAYATLKANLKAGNYGPAGSKRRAGAESKPIVFREDAAQPYDDRILTWNLDQGTVSIWTLAGRIKHVPFVCSPEASKLLQQRRGESDLVMRDGMFFLIATIDLPNPPRTSRRASSAWTSASSTSPPRRTGRSCPAVGSTGTGVA